MNPIDWWNGTDRRFFRQAVLSWYAKNARDLPWRRTKDPYRVWVSEIMLQQTTVATVLGYFKPFLRRFPTIQALARAKEEDVLHAWQGLGYYRRARHLHQAAKKIVSELNGRFPPDAESIRQLPGLGRYTSHAIACFALNERKGILEANTRRLWCRITAADGNPVKAPLEEELWQLAEESLPTKNYADFNQALMDLGSQVCTPREPRCANCPLRTCCQAYLKGAVHDYPQLGAKRAKVDVDHATVVTWDCHRERVLVTRRPADGPWAGLWEFPRVERASEEAWTAAARRAVKTFLGSPFRLREEFFTQKHGIMHYRVTLKCYQASLENADTETGGALSGECRWVALPELTTLPWSTPQRKIVRRLLSGVDFPPATARKTGSRTPLAISQIEGKRGSQRGRG